MIFTCLQLRFILQTNKKEDWKNFHSLAALSRDIVGLLLRMYSFCEILFESTYVLLFLRAKFYVLMLW